MNFLEGKEEEFLERVSSIKYDGSVVIVEGKRDRAALESFGLVNILELSRKPLFEIVEEVVDSGKGCCILTDLDSKGKELYGKLNSSLQRFGVKIDNSMRDFLYKNTDVRQVEGLGNFCREGL